MHPSGLYIFDDRILVEVKEQEAKTAGGIIIPEQIRDKEELKETEALISQMGILAFKDLPDGFAPKDGDKVLISKYAGYLIKGPKNGKNYRLINSGDVLAKIED